MAFRIDDEFRKLLKPLTPAQYAALKLSIETDGIAEGSFWVANVNGDHILLDGHNRYDICVALRLTLPKPKVIKLADRQSCIDWIIAHAGTARDVSPQYMEQLREDRNRRIVERREQGASTRAIAEEENVSRKTVQNVLEKAQVATPSPPDAEKPKIQGIDGKTYSPPKPIFCERCTRTGPVRDCPKCEVARRKRKTTKLGRPAKNKSRFEEKAARNGAPSFSIKTAHMHLGKAMAEADKLKRLPGQLRNPYHAAIQRMMDEISKTFDKWHKEASKVAV